METRAEAAAADLVLALTSGGGPSGALPARLGALLPGCGLAALALPVGGAYVQTHNLLRPGGAPALLRVVPADAPYLAAMHAQRGPVALRVPRCAGASGRRVAGWRAPKSHTPRPALPQARRPPMLTCEPACGAGRGAGAGGSAL